MTPTEFLRGIYFVESLITMDLPSRTAGLELLLDQLSESLEELGEACAEDARNLHALRERLSTGQFHLAVLGQFKRGKSTLLNALLGEEVLPTAILPATAFPTFLRAGRRREIHVAFLNGRTPEKIAAESPGDLAGFLAQFVTQDANPDNRLGVSRVDVLHPAPILRRGLVLIDTPGIGSTFTQNTETTLSFLPQCDAVLFVVSAELPITQVELDFLLRVREKTTRMFLLLNKSDLLGPEQRKEIAEFLRRVVREKVEPEVALPVSCVSARMGLEARQADDPVRWEQSGMAALENQLAEFVAGEKDEALREAIASKARDVAADVLFRLGLTIRSFQIPIEDLEVRLALFEKKVLELERERVESRDLLEGDRRRLLEFLEKQAADLRTHAIPFLQSKSTLYEQDEKHENNHSGPRNLRWAFRGGLFRADAEAETARAALGKAIPVFFQSKMPCLTSELQARLVEILRRHDERARRLAETVRRTAAELFDVPWYPLDPEILTMRRHEPYWVTRQWSTALGMLPIAGWEHLLPRAIRRRRFQCRLAREIEALVVCNAENARWAALQNLDETFRRAGENLYARLGETLDATHGAIRAALDKRRKAVTDAELQLPALHRAAEQLKRMKDMLDASLSPQNQKGE